MRDGDEEEIAEYRRQLRCVVGHGLLTEQEANEYADSIGCVVRLARRGVITLRLAAHLIEKMGAQSGELVAKRTAAWAQTADVGTA